MIRRSTWIALAISALAVAGAIWWRQSGHTFEPTATPTAAPQSLWTLSPPDVVRIRVEGLDESGGLVVAERDPDSDWRLEEPAAEFADLGRLERAVNSLLAPIPRDTIIDGNPANYGLDSPRYEVILALRDGTEFRLVVGNSSPTGEASYVRRPPQEEIHLLAANSLRPVGDLLVRAPVATATASPTSAELGPTDSPGP